MTTPHFAPTAMSQDMAEQPMVLERLPRYRTVLAAELSNRLPRPLTGIVLVGRGSSENAARVGQVLLETWVQVPVLLQPPSTARLYGLEMDARGYLAIGLSQSGQTIEVTETLGQLSRAGACCLAVTSDVHSPLARMADVIFDLRTGVERAVPATKTFTAELAALFVVAQALAVRPLPLPWSTAIAAVGIVLADPEPAREVAIRIGDPEDIFVLGAGIEVGVAQEAALKIMEAAGVAATAMSYESFLHGPLAAADARRPVIAIASTAVGAAEVARIRPRLGRLPVFVVGPGGGADLPIPTGVGQPLALLPATVRVQQLACALAVARGRDPDHPPAIEKVTPL
jgi:glucosamine--fructose-6-phosphate aminotransferase (isomerizing)